jgi:hypothetical protein
MIDTQAIPTARDLLDLDAPELALLGALEHLLTAACVAVETANPELLVERSDEYLERLSLPRLWSAEDIRAHAHTLAEAISRYRHALYLAHDDLAPPPSLPF